MSTETDLCFHPAVQITMWWDVFWHFRVDMCWPLSLQPHPWSLDLLWVKETHSVLQEVLLITWQKDLNVGDTDSTTISPFISLLFLIQPVLIQKYTFFHFHFSSKYQTYCSGMSAFLYGLGLFDLLHVRCGCTETKDNSSVSVFLHCCQV